MLVDVFRLPKQSRHHAEERILEAGHFRQDDAGAAIVRRKVVGPRAGERAAVIAQVPHEMSRRLALGGDDGHRHTAFKGLPGCFLPLGWRKHFDFFGIAIPIRHMLHISERAENRVRFRLQRDGARDRRLRREEVTNAKKRGDEEEKGNNEVKQPFHAGIW